MNCLGLGHGGRFCLWGHRKLKTFERRATKPNPARANSTTQDAAEDSINGGGGGGESLIRNGSGLFIRKYGVFNDQHTKNNGDDLI